MSGHSKWSQIKRKKAITDRNRGRLFTRFIREIQIAARLGGADPEGNPRLRFAIELAKRNSMPADNIKRAIARGAGGEGSDALVEGLYEAYGPNGVALVVETASDNKNRTVGEIRHIVGKYGGNLGEAGSVGWMFQRVGTLIVPKASSTKNAIAEDDLMMLALEAGATDVRTDDPEYFEVQTTPEEFDRIRDTLSAAGLPIEDAKISRLATTIVSLSNGEAEKLMRLVEALEECDDVQHVYTNADIDDAIA